MAVNQEPDSVVTAESKIDEIDGGGTCFMTVKIEKDVAPVRELTSSTIGGGKGCNIFVPVFGGKGTKIAPTGHI